MPSAIVSNEPLIAAPSNCVIASLNVSTVVPNDFMFPVISFIAGAAAPILASLSNGLSAPSKLPKPSIMLPTNPPALNAAIPTANDTSAGPSNATFLASTPLSNSKLPISSTIAGAAIATATANGTSANPNAPIAAAPTAIIGAIGAIKNAATPNAPNANMPMPTPAQLMSANCWNALPAINIAPPNAASTTVPSNALGLPIAASPLPKPFNAPPTISPKPLPSDAPALPTDLARLEITLPMPFDKLFNISPIPLEIFDIPLPMLFVRLPAFLPTLSMAPTSAPPFLPIILSLRPPATFFAPPVILSANPLNILGIPTPSAFIVTNRTPAAPAILPSVLTSPPPVNTSANDLILSPK